MINKKYDAAIDGKNTVACGASGYSDFPKHKDEERKKLVYSNTQTQSRLEGS